MKPDRDPILYFFYYTCIKYKYHPPFLRFLTKAKCFRGMIYDLCIVRGYVVRNCAVYMIKKYICIVYT